MDNEGDIMFRSLIYERYVGVYAESDEITVTLNGEKAVIIRTHSEFADSNIIKKTLPTDEFVSIFNSINIFAWKDEYYAPIMDGESWSLKYYTDDGKCKKVKGSNAYPKNYDELIELLF